MCIRDRSNFVVSAETINTFKNRLDKFWSDQDVLFDYKADLHGIGNFLFILFIYYYAIRQPDIVIQHDTAIQKF